MNELKPYEIAGITVVCDLEDRFGNKSRKRVHLPRFGGYGKLEAMVQIGKYKSCRKVAVKHKHPWNINYVGSKPFVDEERTLDELERDGFAIFGK